MMSLVFVAAAMLAIGQRSEWQPQLTSNFILSVGEYSTTYRLEPDSFPAEGFRRSYRGSKADAIRLIEDSLGGRYAPYEQLDDPRTKTTLITARYLHLEASDAKKRRQRAALQIAVNEARAGCTVITIRVRIESKGSSERTWNHTAEDDEGAPGFTILSAWLRGTRGC